jgi:hypothetical protein
MKFLLSVILIALFSAGAEVLIPSWWVIAVVAFLVSLFVEQKAGRAFLAGFLGIALFWLVAALIHDSANDHILSTKMAVLFHLPNYVLFIGVTALVGGLVGGLSGWAGALIRPCPDERN